MKLASPKRREIYRKFIFGYTSLSSIPLIILAISIYKNAGGAGLVPGIPIYLVLFGGATYQFAKELRALKNEEKEEASKSHEQ
ncbi:hypothetical protein AB4851_03065 [Burkholderia sp. 22PA0099]|uniref:hypothetical protein n=1 Tax=Burkholderia sp. 22PA0099 TaxID=3237372 RepID=UPI0039C23B76